MKVVTGRVVEGKVVPQADGLPEGAVVTIVVGDADTFELTVAEEQLLAEALEEADRGDVVPAEEVLASLRRRG